MTKSISSTKEDSEQPENDKLRGLEELQEAMDLLWHQIWYNRNVGRLIAIHGGKINKDACSRQPSEMQTTHHDTFEREMKILHDALRRFGNEDFGPWDDFEWGMINGKLSAIRWVLGYEWDVLDT